MEPPTQQERFTHHSEGALTKDQMRSFFEEGYVIIKQLFTPEQITLFKLRSKSVLEGATATALKYIADNNITEDTEFRCDYGGPKGPKTSSLMAVYSKDKPLGIKLVNWIGAFEPDLLNLGRQVKITVPVAQLLGDAKADHLINQLHRKIPNDQVAFDWHQDIQNRREFDPEWRDVNGRGSFVQVLTAIDKQTATNGPLIVIPNSHRIDLSLEKQKTNEDKERIIRQKYDIEKMAVPLLMEPGDTVFMHPLVVHKSDPNTSTDGETRGLFINGFSYPGANRKPYPGIGSSQTIPIQITPDLLNETKTFVSQIAGN